MQFESPFETFLVPFPFMMLLSQEARMQCKHTYPLHPLCKGYGSIPEPLWDHCQTNFTDGGKLIFRQKLLSKPKLICLVKVYVILSIVSREVWNRSGCVYLVSPAWGEWVSSTSGVTLWTQLSLAEGRYNRAPKTSGSAFFLVQWPRWISFSLRFPWLLRS